MLIKGVNINCRTQDFIGEILDGLKTVETREGNSLKSLVGQRIGLIRTGCGKATLEGFADVVEVIRYDDWESFEKDYGRHRVLSGSKYDIKAGKCKYGYVLANVQRCDPVPVTAKGIVIRNLDI